MNGGIGWLWDGRVDHTNDCGVFSDIGVESSNTGESCRLIAGPKTLLKGGFGSWSCKTCGEDTSKAEEGEEFHDD